MFKNHNNCFYVCIMCVCLLVSSSRTIFIISEFENLEGKTFDVFLVHVFLCEDVVESLLLLFESVHEVKKILLGLVVTEPLDEGDALLQGVELAVVAHDGVTPLELLCVLDEREYGFKCWWEWC